MLWASAAGVALLRVQHVVQLEFVEGEALQPLVGQEAVSLSRQVWSEVGEKYKVVW